MSKIVRMKEKANARNVTEYKWNSANKIRDNFLS